MKLIYNIINYRSGSGGLFEFKIHLTKADWILINQFKAKPLSVTCSVTDADHITELSDNISIGKINFRNTELIFDIGLTFNEIKQEEDDSEWESPPFKINLLILEFPLSNMLEYITAQLKEQMLKKKQSISQNDDSCWAEELVIDY